MKLAQYHKQAIVLAIERDLPKWDMETVQKRLQEDLYKAMSKECRALYRKSPNALKTGISYDVGPNRTGTLIVGDANLDEIKKPYAAEYAKRQAAIRQLKAAVEGCSTRKQFIDRFPEFSNYAPSEEGTCPTLPAIANVVAGLIEIGFVPKVVQG